MEKFNKNNTFIRRICVLMMILGILEMIAIILFTNVYYFALLGFITAIPAYLTFINHHKRRNQLLPIFIFLKYNPISIIVFTFLLFNLMNMPMGARNPILTLLPLIVMVFGGAFITLGVFLIIFINKHNKLLEADVLS